MTTYTEKTSQRFAGESNDCSVIATSIVCQVDYATAHTALKEQGRKKGRGTYNYQTVDACKKLGMELRKLPNEELIQPNGCGYTAATIGQKLRKGRFLVSVRGHIFAVVDGEVQDWTKGRRHRVRSVQEVTSNMRSVPVKSARRISIKDQVREQLKRNPWGLTVAQLCKATGGSEATVRTAISDLKNPKYAGAGGALNIVKTTSVFHPGPVFKVV